jgi:hypothetical protein
VSSDTTLRVGPVCISTFPRGIDDDFLSVFRDDMVVAWEDPVDEYSCPIGEGPGEPEPDRLMVAMEFAAPGPVIAQRLDLMGFTPGATRAILDKELAKKRPRKGDSGCVPWTSQDWIAALASSADDPEAVFWQAGTRPWLFHVLEELDACVALRVALLAFPESDVTLDLPTSELADWLYRSSFGKIASHSRTTLSRISAMRAPIIVLTEGTTDAEFITAAIDVLYPHLNDVIRCLDYDQKPESGASAVVKMARAFAAAGISNRVVAIFDNDAAGISELRTLDRKDRKKLPRHIRACAYPHLPLAEWYPALPAVGSGTSPGTIEYANVNGSGAGIELYLGEDVLTGPDGQLRPLEWRPITGAHGPLQGRVTGKNAIQKAFRKKYRLAKSDHDLVSSQDWSGMQLIIGAIRAAAQEAFSDGPPAYRVMVDL